MSQINTEQTYFALPTAPEEFSVLLPPAALRKIDFSALEFATARRAVIEYIKTYFPNEFNDFVANNGIIMLVELLSYLTALLSLRADILSNEGFLPTAQTEDAVTNHLALINQRILPATPASVDVECSVESPVSADVHIPPLLYPLQVPGEDGKPINYELFSAPDDTISNIIIPAGKRSVIAYGLEGVTKNSTAVSDGTPNQQIVINDRSVLDQPISVTITNGSSIDIWTRVDAIEAAASTDKSYEAQIFQNRLVIVFGDNTTGVIPHVGAIIQITYRTGGGTRGRIGAGVISTQRPIVPEQPYNAPVQVQFTNLNASIGGSDRETLDQAKKRGPRDFATQGAAVTASDYAQIATSFSHPAFGSVLKAVATIRTDINANLVELYILAQGQNGLPQLPSEGLKRALVTALDEVNVITDEVRVMNGCIKPINLQITVVMSKNADASVVKTNVESSISSFFDIDNWDMGEPLYISKLYTTLNAVDGVSYVDIMLPADNILPTGQLCTDAGSSSSSSSGSGSSTGAGVGLNEVITIGSQEISYYYEQ